VTRCVTALDEGKVKSMKLVCVVAGLALLVSPVQPQEQNAVTVTQLLSTTATSSGHPIVLRQKDAEIVFSTYDMVPGATLPVDKLFAWFAFGKVIRTRSPGEHHGSGVE
jgi:hypothetical protein